MRGLLELTQICFSERPRFQNRPFPNEPLGGDYDAACAATIFLPAFDSWRSGGDDASATVGIRFGTVDWMFHEYCKTWPIMKACRRIPI